MKYKIVAVITLLFSNFVSHFACADWVERTRDQFGTEHSHFVYPLLVSIPGIGEASGLGTTILNISNSDTDFSGFMLRGDFDVVGGTILNYHIIKNTLLADFGAYNFIAALNHYDRGIDSDPNSYIAPKIEGQFYEAQLSWALYQRHIESFIHLTGGTQTTTDIINADGSRFPVSDDEPQQLLSTTLGIKLDNTDDRLHPSRGYRLEAGLKIPRNTDNLISDYVVTDYNSTFYLPFRKRDTLAFNFFRSDAHVIHPVQADFATLKAERGLNCASSDIDCTNAEAEYIQQLQDNNRYGTATALGGTQRLRSYSNARFYAGHSVSYGAEYRLSLNDARKPFDFFIIKGIRTGMQLAFFAEQGSVADRTSELFDTLKTSYGMGFRVVLSGVILRADYSNGSEGWAGTVYLDYPWTLPYAGEG